MFSPCIAAAPTEDIETLCLRLFELLTFARRVKLA